MFCYAVFHNSQQVRVFPYTPHGSDWRRARTLAIEMAQRAEKAGYHYTVEHFGATDVGAIIWK